MKNIKFYLYGIAAVSIVIAIIGARWYWISEGKIRCKNAVAAKTQEKVIDNEKKLRPIRSYRPSMQSVVDRLRSDTF